MATRFDIARAEFPETPEKAEPSNGISSFSFDEDVGNDHRRRPFFRGALNEHPRITFLSNPQGAMTHWVGRGYILCKKNMACCGRIGRPKWRIGVVIFRFGDQAFPQGQVMPWIFSERTYAKIREAHAISNVEGHDFRIDCNNDRFQDVTIVPVGNTLVSQQDRDSYAKDIKICKNQIQSCLGADLTIEEINAIQSQGDPPVGPVDILRNIA